MKTKTKIILLVILIISVTFIIISVNTMYNFKKYELTTIESKAQILAKTVEHSLTFQMVHNVIQERELFLSQLKDIPDVNKIWLSRGQKVKDLYGNGLNDENAQDEIDKEVLKTGLSKKVVEDNLFSQSSYRITIPYNASSKGKINCMKCHTNAKEGDTLGAISIQVITDESKKLRIIMIINMVAIAFILTIIVTILLNIIVSPFLSIFDSIKKVMNKAQEGDYSYRVDDINDKEAQDVSLHVNNLLEKLETTLDDIDSNISIFLSTDQKLADKDHLINVKRTVRQLSDVYRFKKTIEYEETLENVYDRLAQVLRTKLKFDNFNFFEINTTNKRIKNVYSTHKVICNVLTTGCRADVINKTIDSTEFKNVCSSCESCDKINYFCIPYSISDQLDLIISIYPTAEIETPNVEEISHYIQDYINEAKAVIMNKKLMSILEKNAQTDALTGLYNRQYLTNTISKTRSQLERSNSSLGILLLDIDYFKMINDTYGHDAGDSALRIVSKILVENIREADVAIRFGGEEFLILLYNCNEKSINTVAEKIRINFSKKDIYVGDMTVINKTVSIGTAMYPKDSKDLGECIRYADFALYEAKNKGRNKVVNFDPKLLKK